MEIIDNSIVEQIELRMIRPTKFPVRYGSQKNTPELEYLKNSITQHGLLQPILVRPLEHGFEIVAGHRRFTACKSLRWRFIPCKINEFSDKEAYEIQLTENLQRKSMDPIEEAEAFQKYVIDYGWGGISELGKKIGKSEEYVSHRMQLLKLPEDVKAKITNNSLSVSKALEITSINHAMKSEIVEEIVTNKLTVRQIRKMKDKLNSETGVSSYKTESSKEQHIIKKSTLALKITLSRIDDLIEEAHTITTKDRIDLINFLMDMRRKTHTMIDEIIKFKKNS